MVAEPGDPRPFRCPNAGRDDTDHVMTRVLDPALIKWPKSGEQNPFVRYRTLFHAYHLARSRGMPDTAYVDLVEDLDRRVAEVDGRGFASTPFGRSDGLSSALGFLGPGGVWVKDETGAVGGSHKARHLMGLLILLEVADRVGLSAGPPGSAALAIASCGNAALAAAVVARAGGRELEVFVPTWADPMVVGALRRHRATIRVIPRDAGVAGDPTFLAMREAVRGGAVPFTCQGTENGMAIEGGETLGYEIASELSAGGFGLDLLFVQVGGGALASACAQSLREALALGALDGLPRIHAVQTKGAHPLARAFRLLAARILMRLGENPQLAGTQEGADLILAKAEGPEVSEELDHAASKRSEFMWPWEHPPKSVATGILDDETYDWLAVTRAMIETGGYPVLVSEERLEEANAMAREQAGADVDHTGTSGLAGLIEMCESGRVGSGEKVAVLFTGRRRGGPEDSEEGESR
jgi:threonine synthase